MLPRIALALVVAIVSLAACSSERPDREDEDVDDPPVAAADDSVAAIPVGYQSNGGVAVGLGAVWVTNQEGWRRGGTVSRIDPTTNTVIETIPVGNEPRGVAVGFGSVWMIEESDAVVYRVDPTESSVIATVELVTPQSDMDTRAFGFNGRIAAGEGSVWVVFRNDGAVYRIDPSNNEVTRFGLEISSGAEMKMGGVAAGDGLIWATGFAWTEERAGFLIRIDPATGDFVVSPVVEGAEAIAIGGGSVWVVGCSPVEPPFFVEKGRCELDRIDPSTGRVMETVVLAELPDVGVRRWSAVRADLAVGESGVWITTGFGNRVFRVDPDSNSVTRVLQVGDSIAEHLAFGFDAVWIARGCEHDLYGRSPYCGQMGNDVDTVARLDPGGP